MRIELDSHVIHKFYLLMENVEKNNKKDFSTYELRVSSFLIDQCYPLFLRDTFKGWLVLLPQCTSTHGSCIGTGQR